MLKTSCCLMFYSSICVESCCGVVCSGYGVSNAAAYSQPVSQASAASYTVGQQQTAQYGPYGNRIQVSTLVCPNLLFGLSIIVQISNLGLGVRMLSRVGVVTRGFCG